MLVRGPGLTADRAEEPGDAAPRLQLPLPRTEARRHRRQRRLHSPRMEDAAESTQDIGFECKL